MESQEELKADRLEAYVYVLTTNLELFGQAQEAGLKTAVMHDPFAHRSPLSLMPGIANADGIALQNSEMARERLNAMTRAARGWIVGTMEAAVKVNQGNTGLYNLGLLARRFESVARTAAEPGVGVFRSAINWLNLVALASATAVLYDAECDRTDDFGIFAEMARSFNIPVFAITSGSGLSPALHSIVTLSVPNTRQGLITAARIITSPLMQPVPTAV